MSSPLFHNRPSVVAAHSGLCACGCAYIMCGEVHSDLAQECSKISEAIKMCLYVHAFVICLASGSPRPVADRRPVHSPQDLTVVSLAPNCTAIVSKLVIRVH